MFLSRDILIIDSATLGDVAYQDQKREMGRKERRDTKREKTNEMCGAASVRELPHVLHLFARRHGRTKIAIYSEHSKPELFWVA